MGVVADLEASKNNDNEGNEECNKNVEEEEADLEEVEEEMEEEEKEKEEEEEEDAEEEAPKLQVPENPKGQLIRKVRPRLYTPKIQRTKGIFLRLMK